MLGDGGRHGLMMSCSNLYPDGGTRGSVRCCARERAGRGRPHRVRAMCAYHLPSGLHPYPTPTRATSAHTTRHRMPTASSHTHILPHLLSASADDDRLGLKEGALLGEERVACVSVGNDTTRVPNDARWEQGRTGCGGWRQREGTVRSSQTAQNEWGGMWGSAAPRGNPRARGESSAK